MEQIRLVFADTLSNEVKQRTQNSACNLQLKPEEGTLKIRIGIISNSNSGTSVSHLSVSVWENVGFTFSPGLKSSPNWEILIGMVQASFGHARMLFSAENKNNGFDYPGFLTNSQIDELLKLTLLSHNN